MKKIMANKKENEKNVKPAQTKTEAGVKIVVLNRFKDRYDNNISYEPGQELEFDEVRAKDVVERGLAKYLSPDPSSQGLGGGASANEEGNDNKNSENDGNKQKEQQ
jgi:hypothetical protein